MTTENKDELKLVGLDETMRNDDQGYQNDHGFCRIYLSFCTYPENITKLRGVFKNYI